MSGKLTIKTLTLAVVAIFFGLILVPIINGGIILKEGETLNEDETEYYAVIAACSRYEHRKLNIPLPPFRPVSEKKLKYLYDTLIQSENWKKNNILLLINEQATIQNITNALDNMSERVDQNDIFLFSWQGHGSEVYEDPNRGPMDEEDGIDEVICPYECYRDKGGVLHNYITDDELDEKFDNINAKGMCIIFECCLSGGLQEISNIENDNYHNNYKSSFLKEFNQANMKIDNENGKNRILIMSTNPGYLGKASFLTGFPLTRALAQGFKRKTADKNKDGFISAEEAFTWAKPRAILQSLFYWFSTWLVSIIEYKIKGDKYPVLKSTIVLMLSYVILQLYIYKKSNHFIANSPNILDTFDGELNIINS